MDLLSMLNNDDSTPAGPSISVTDHRPTATIVTDQPTVALDGPGREIIKEESSLSRKRQRIEDSPSSSPVVIDASSAAATKPRLARDDPPLNPGISPHEGPKPLPSRSPVSRNNSVIMTHELYAGFEPSIVNIEPSEELTRLISNFIFVHLNEEGLEVHTVGEPLLTVD
jgi:hypothetical protein